MENCLALMVNQSWVRKANGVRLIALNPMLSNCVVGGEPGWLVIARTRHKHVRVGSVATSLSLTVLAITNHPGSGHADDIPNG